MIKAQDALGFHRCKGEHFFGQTLDPVRPRQVGPVGLKHQNTVLFGFNPRLQNLQPLLFFQRLALDPVGSDPGHDNDKGAQDKGLDVAHGEHQAASIMAGASVRIATLRRAERALGLRLISSSPGTVGRLRVMRKLGAGRSISGKCREGRGA